MDYNIIGAIASGIAIVAAVVAAARYVLGPNRDPRIIGIAIVTIVVLGILLFKFSYNASTVTTGPTTPTPQPTAGPTRTASTPSPTQVPKKWAFLTGGAVAPSPTVVNDVVYVGSDDGHLYTLDAASGQEKWAFLTGGIVSSSPTVVNGLVYVGSSDHHLYAFALPETSP